MSNDFINFHRITLSGETLKISSAATEDGDIHNKSLVDHPVSLRVSDWSVKIEQPPSPANYNSIIPFGSVNVGNIDLAKISFGKIDKLAKVEIKTEKDLDKKDWAKQSIATTSAFYMVVIGESSGPGGTIGTDDMRNGKANINIFSLEGNHGVCLKIVKDGAKRSLEIGYY